MKRNVSLEEISDGKLYGLQDMVKADCHGCKGCSKCCQGMGESIILDPYDVYRMTLGLHRSFQEFLSYEVELNVVDGVILPNLRMVQGKDACAFLNAEGRCSIHSYRPGVCRLFPLGRYYENGDFRYFLQIGECVETHSKVKVSKWIDTPNLCFYHDFLNKWHNLVNQLERLLYESDDDEFCKNLNMYFLKNFFLTPYIEEDFYIEFSKRLAEFRKIVPEDV